MVILVIALAQLVSFDCLSQANATAAKAYLCCAFVACEDRTFDLVAGGSNGIVYLFRAGAVVATCQAFRAKVRVLVVGGDRVYCGGGGGIVKILDARTLTIMQQFNLLPVEPTAGPRVGSAGPARSTRTPATSGLSGIGANKPRPASAGPGARLAHRALAIKPKADLSAPKHAAGQNVAPYSGTAGEAIGGAGMRGSKEEGEIPDNDDGSGSKVVTGIAVVRGLGRVGAAANYLLVALGTGKVVRLAPYVLDLEKQARTVAVDVQFDDVPQDVHLLAGHSADIEVILAQQTMKRLPTEAVQEGNRVLLFDAKTGTLSTREFTRGLSNWSWTGIEKGL